MVLALILHTLAAPGAGPLTRLLVSARAANAARLAASFAAARADVRRIDVDPADGRSFGERLAALAAGGAAGTSPHEDATGWVIAGSGAVPLARARDLRAFVYAAGGGVRALANNRYSADIVALPDPARLAGLPGLVEDNALPRWLEEVAGLPVDDLRGRWRLQVDLDSPLDLLLLGQVNASWRAVTSAGVADDGLLATARDRLEGVSATLADRRAEVLVAGRTSSSALRVLEAAAEARIRAWVEERGLRAGSPLAQGPTFGGAGRPARPPRSILGLLLDREGPGALGSLLAGLADAALVDTRVLLAHRLGVDERDWPSAEDRFASDLLLPDLIADPWLRSLTGSAVEATIPIALGAHTLVGPGSRLLVRRRWSPGRRTASVRRSPSRRQARSREGIRDG